jgi:hypothetical protein
LTERLRAKFPSLLDVVLETAAECHVRSLRAVPLDVGSCRLVTDREVDADSFEALLRGRLPRLYYVEVQVEPCQPPGPSGAPTAGGPRARGRR